MKLCFAVAALAAAGSVCAQVIDFEGARQDNNSVNLIGQQWQEDGFTVAAPNLSNFGTQESRYPGSTAVFSNVGNGLIRVTRDGGGSFSVVSIDFSNLNSPGQVFIDLRNSRGENLRVSHTDPDGQLPLTLSTSQLGQFGQNVTFIEWNQVSPFHQFDNIVIPAPTGAGALALGGLVALRRRR